MCWNEGTDDAPWMHEQKDRTTYAFWGSEGLLPSVLLLTFFMRMRKEGTDDAYWRRTSLRMRVHVV